MNHASRQSISSHRRIGSSLAILLNWLQIEYQVYRPNKSITVIQQFKVMYNLIFGIDISKATFDVYCKSMDLSRYEHRCFTNDPSGFKKFFRWYNRHTTDEDSPMIIMEYIGYFSFKFCSFLTMNDLLYSPVNPIAIKRSMGVQREKTDKKDAEIIADYGLKFQDCIHLDSVLDEELMEIHMLLSQRKYFLKQELAMHKQVKLFNYCIGTTYSTALVKHVKSLKELTKKRRVKLDKRLLEIVSNSSKLKQHFNLLLSIPGVGVQTAYYLLVYTRNFTRLTDPRKFACYAGVAPFKHESGSSIRRRTRVSHIANKTMKGLLHMGAMNAIKVDPELRHYYLSKVESGKAKMSALNAVRNKIIHRIFAVIKRGTPFVIRPVFN